MTSVMRPLSILCALLLAWAACSLLKYISSPRVQAIELNPKHTYQDPFDGVEAHNASISSPRVHAIKLNPKHTYQDPFDGVEAHNASLESNVTCLGSQRNMSCMFKNLYRMHGSFWLLVLKNSPLLSMKISLGLDDFDWARRLTPRMRQFSKLSDLAGFVSKVRFEALNGVSLIFDLPHAHAIGHSLWNGLYAAFVALCRFHLHASPFHVLAGLSGVTNSQREQHQISWDIVHVFSRARARVMSKRVLRLDVAIAGSNCLGPFGAKTALYTLPGGRDLDAPRHFRDRMLQAYGLLHQRPRARPPIIAIVNNKRYDVIQRKMLMSIKEIGGLTVEFIDWGKVGPFKQQLQKLLTIAVHVSGPGTGSMNVLFMLDGSVHVNLGYAAVDTGTPFPSFLEEYLVEGATYLSALYYNSTKVLCGVHEAEMRSLLQKAVDLFHNGKVPTSPGSNLSPAGQVWRKFCANGDCSDVDSWMRSAQGCGGYIEFVIYEQAGFDVGFSASVQHGPYHYGRSVPPCGLTAPLRKRLLQLRKGVELAPIIDKTSSRIECKGSEPYVSKIACTCSPSNGSWPLLVPWRNATKQCFELVDRDSGRRLLSGSWRVELGWKGNYKLHSCTQVGYYVSFNRSSFFLTAAREPDVWLLPFNMSAQDSCLPFRLAKGAVSVEKIVSRAHLGVQFSEDGTVLLRASAASVCLQFAIPSTVSPRTV